MPQLHVDNLEDPRISHYRDLPGSIRTEQMGRFVVEGGLLVERLIASRFPVESVLVERKRHESFRAIIPDSVTLYIVPDGMLEKIIGFNFHRGILGCGIRLPPLSLDDVLSLRELPRRHLSIQSVATPADQRYMNERLTATICVDIHDPTNLGAILRNCAAFGVDVVLLSEQCADAFSRRVIRVSMGAALRVPIVRSTDILTDLRRLAVDHHVELAAMVLADDAEIVDSAKRRPCFGLVVGNEGKGLPSDVVACCQRKITLPMSHDTDSLNAAVATGVFLYHFTRPHSFTTTMAD